jgi:pimeloyl-ACP methyl ester carboxylesterase
MKIWIACLILLPFWASAQSQEVSIVSNGVRIGATLLEPSAPTAEVVLIISGSGPTDRNGNQAKGMSNNSLKLLAEALADEGIASLRYDKRGLPGSPMDTTAMKAVKFNDFVVDIAQLISYLRDLGKYSKITVIGHSLGSLEGSLAAQREKIDRFIALAGMGSSMSETLKRQLGKHGPFVSNMANPIIDSLNAGMTVRSVPLVLEPLFGPHIQPYLIELMRYEPGAELGKLTCPVLIVNGSTDLQVTPDDGKKLYDASAKSTFVLIDEMNHVLKKVSDNMTANLATYNMPELSLHPDLMPVITRFIRSN